MSKNPLLIVLGPTASGKTRLAVDLATALNGEIISADSRQIFRGMDIGTGKDLVEYERNGIKIPHHLINIKNAGEKYNVNEFKEDFYRIFEDINSRNRLPMLCGGTGMYIHSLLQNQEYTAVPVNDSLRAELQTYDVNKLRTILSTYPKTTTRQADQSSQKRLMRAIEIAEYLKHHLLIKKDWPGIDPLVVGLRSDVASRRRRIAYRLEQRLDDGLIDEVKALLDEGVSKKMLTYYGLEYKFVTAYIHHQHTLEQLKEQLFYAICQFAKRQMTFFRKMEKDGVRINWFDADADPHTLKSDILKLTGQFVRG